MLDTIRVGKPEICIVYGKARLTVQLQGCSVDSLFFEVNEEYKEYLCTEDSDAFLLMLMEYAQLHSKNIQFEGPISAALIDYVNEYYIPLLSQNMSQYAQIRVIAKACEAKKKYCGQAVGTGFSAGVDSFYTIYKQLETPFESLRLTHVLFANVGAQTYEYADSCKIFDEKSKRLQNIITQVDDKINFIEVNTNCLELYSDLIGKGFTGPDARKTCSCVVALKKLFSVYYFSNGPTLDRFSFSSKDPAHFDLFTIEMLNHSGIRFYLRGIETPKRIDKVKYISDKKTVQNNLSVCINKNCGICEKCIRTELELFAIQKLDAFETVFDLVFFKKNMVKLTAKYLAISEEHQLGFVKEIETEARKNGVKLPRMAYVRSFFVDHPIYIAKKEIKKILRRRGL